jgi:DNA-binding beta-propeller fold protein YncE
MRTRTLHIAPRRPAGWLLRAAGLAVALAGTASAATAAPVVTPYVAGLNVGTGMAYHPTNQHVYYLEAGAGKLSKVNTANGVVTTIQTGLVHPDDVALWPNANIAYITTRVGELWRASTTSNARSLVASGLGIPLQLVLDPANMAAYTVDYGSGTLWKVDLLGGTKTSMVSGLSSPRGLLMSTDFKTAFITESTRLVSVDLVTQQVTEIVGSLVNPWYMTWAADDHSAIYLVDRDPGNRLHRIDLSVSPAALNAIVPLPAGPWSVVRSLNPDVLYVASKTVLSKISLSGGAGGPIITRLGFIPSTEVDPVTGQATTDPAYFYYVKNASFGGSIHVMLNFPGMLASGAGYYKVFVDGGSDIATWTNYKWVVNTFVLQNVGPSSGFYKIPSPGDVWAIPDLGFVLDSTKYSNAKHTLRVALYDPFLAPLNIEGTVDLLFDNVPPVMDIQSVEHDGQPLDECALITSGSADITITFKAYDAEGHLYNYGLEDHWGSGKSAAIASDQYIGVHDGSPTWFGVNPQSVVYTFSNTACAHQIALGGWSNTTNGYSHVHYASDTEHIAIYLGGIPCQP